jgi:hypothetical protein
MFKKIYNKGPNKISPIPHTLNTKKSSTLFPLFEACLYLQFNYLSAGLYGVFTLYPQGAPRNFVYFLLAKL